MLNTESNVLLDIYQRLYVHFGPQHWWPGETRFEIIVGAILTQSASWSNVEKAIGKLKNAGALEPPAMRSLSQEQLAGLVRSSGYYNMKAKKLLAFVNWLEERYQGSLDRMLAVPTETLRRELLEVHGIGEETADSILLYAGSHPVFVIDAYTRRIVDRLGLPVAGPDYSDYQTFFMRRLPADTAIYNEFHALLVAQGKYHCIKTKPRCEECCLNKICPPR